MNLTKSQLFWKNHIKECRKSNLSQAEYCRRNGLKKSSFSAQKSCFKKGRTINQEELVQDYDKKVVKSFISLEKENSSFSIILNSGHALKFNKLPDFKWVAQFLEEVHASQS